MRRIFPLGWSFVLLMAAVPGCGPGTPYVEGSQEEASVKGSVKVRGKRIDGGEVHFNPSNSKRRVGVRDAPIGRDGTFEVRTLVGPNVVTVTPARSRDAARKKALLGLEYEEKSVDVRSGENAVELDFFP